MMTQDKPVVVDPPILVREENPTPISTPAVRRSTRERRPNPKYNPQEFELSSVKNRRMSTGRNSRTPRGKEDSGL